MTNAVAAALAFVLGAMIGSFLNVCISRLPAGLSIVHPRSRCPRCETPIAWYDNVPIVSWLLLRARCRSCGIAISAVYPAVELTTGALWMAAFAAFGPTFLSLRIAVFGTVLLGIAVTDAQVFRIPDGFTVFGFVWVLATAVAAWFLRDDTPFAGPGAALIGACAAAGAIRIAGWLGEVALRREAMGFGDETLMAVVGAAVGPVRGLLAIFVGALLAVLSLPLLRAAGVGTSREDTDEDAESTAGHIPFGVFLAPAGLIALLWGDALMDWYMQTTGMQ